MYLVPGSGIITVNILIYGNIIKIKIPDTVVSLPHAMAILIIPYQVLNGGGTGTRYLCTRYQVHNLVQQYLETQVRVPSTVPGHWVQF